MHFADHHDHYNNLQANMIRENTEDKYYPSNNARDVDMPTSETSSVNSEVLIELQFKKHFIFDEMGSTMDKLALLICKYDLLQHTVLDILADYLCRYAKALEYSIDASIEDDRVKDAVFYSSFFLTRFLRQILEARHFHSVIAMPAIFDTHPSKCAAKNYFRQLILPFLSIQSSVFILGFLLIYF